MIVRVTEQVASVVEVSYDVTMPDGESVDEVEDFLDREADEVHREALRSHREIMSVEKVLP